MLIKYSGNVRLQNSYHNSLFVLINEYLLSFGYVILQNILEMY